MHWYEIKLPATAIQNDVDLDIIDATLPWLNQSGVISTTTWVENESNELTQKVQKRYVCEKCGRICLSLSGLKRHKQYMHHFHFGFQRDPKETLSTATTTAYNRIVQTIQSCLNEYQ